jgi:hypothetical protein
MRRVQNRWYRRGGYSSKLTLFKKKKKKKGNCKMLRRAWVFRDLAFTQENCSDPMGSRKRAKSNVFGWGEIKVFFVAPKILLRGLSHRVNYIDRATAACRRR